MQKQRITAPSPKVIFFDKDLDDLCCKILKEIDQNSFQSILPDSQTLMRSLAFISNPQVALKAFSILVSLCKIFLNQRDHPASKKFLSHAEQILHYVKNPSLLSQYSKLKELLSLSAEDENSSANPVQSEFLQLINEPSCFPLRFSTCLDFVAKERDYFKKPAKRPSTAGKHKNQTCPTPVHPRLNLNSATRPSSAKRPAVNRSGQFENTENMKEKVSAFNASLVEKSFTGKKRHKSEDFSQRIDLLTPPKTPEGLIKLNILIESQKGFNQSLRKPLGVGKRPADLPAGKERRKTQEQVREFKKNSEVKTRVIRDQNGRLKDQKNDLKERHKTQVFRTFKDKKEGLGIKTKDQTGMVHRPKKDSASVRLNEKKAEVEEKVHVRKCRIVRKIITRDYLARVIKIQAFFRGYLVREKFSLIKNKKTCEKCLVLLLEGQIFHVKIRKFPDFFRVFAETSETVRSFDLTSAEMQNFKKFNFFLDHGNLNYSEVQKSETPSFFYLFTCKSVINDKTCEVSFSANKKKTLTKAELFVNGKSFELTVPVSENKEIEVFIQDSIRNYLTITEDQLKLDYPRTVSEKVLVFKVNCKQSNKNLTIFIYKLLTSERSEIEFCIIDDTTPAKVLFFIPDENFSHFFENSIFPHNSFIYFFAIDYKNPGKTLEKMNFRFIHSIKKQISNKDLIFRCFLHTSNKKKYLFECIHPEQVLTSSLQLSASQIRKLFRVKSGEIESSIETILNNFSLQNDSLVAIPVPKLSTNQLSQSVNFLKMIKKVQIRFKERFKRNKKALENLGVSLIFTQAKKIQGTIFNFHLYKVEQGLIVEVFSDHGCLAYKLVKHPLRYVSALNKIADLHKLIDATTVINNKIVITRAQADIYADDPENSFYVETHFKPDTVPDDDEWPMFMVKELNFMTYILKATLDEQKSLVVKLIPLKGTLSPLSRKFSQDEIVKHLGIFDPKSLIPSLRVSYGNIVTSDLVRYSLPAQVDELLNVHIISKIAVRVANSMYLICVAFAENAENYEESELKFFAKLNSSLEGCRKTIIGLSQAASITGIDPKAVSVIAEYISKNMIVINSDEFYIDCSKPPVVLDKFIVKLQALIRGYKARRKNCVKLVFLFKESFKIQGSSFTILIYMLFNKNYLAAVKRFDVFKSKLSEGFMEKFYRTGNKKAFVFQEVLNNLKSSDKKFTFLRDSESKSPLRRRPTIELAKASVVPNLVGILRLSTMKANEDYNLLTTFSITPNLLTFYVKVYQNESRTFIEITLEDEVLTKTISNDVKDFEVFGKLIHVDVERKKIIIEEKCLLNRIVFVDGKKASIIIFKNKNGHFIDGCTLEDKKPSFIYLGDNSKINSIMTKLRISSGKIVISNF